MTEPNPPQAVERLSRSILALSFAGALVFLYLRTFLLPDTPFVGIGDQILFFSRAVRIVHGQVLYRDFFEIVPPGTDLLYAAVFRLLGIHAWVMPALGIALGLGLACVITRIAGRILHGPLILLPALLFLVFDFSSALDLTHHWYSTLAALSAVSVLMGGANLQRIVAAGSLCALATLFTQTQGALTFLALAIYLLWLKRSEAEDSGILMLFGALVLPFALILSCVLGYYSHKAGFRTIFFDLVLFPLRFLSSGEVNSPRTYLRQFPPVQSPADILRLIPFVFIYAIVPYIYLLGLYHLWQRRSDLPSRLRQHLVLLHLTGLALFLAVASGPRFFRLSTVAPPAILICTWLFSQPSRVARFVRDLLCILAAFFVLLLPLRRQTQWHATLNLPIGQTAFSDILVYHEFQWLAQRTHPSELFFNSSALCLYLSLANPTPSEFVSYNDFTRPEQVSAVVQSLQRHPPHFVVLLSESTKSSDARDHAAPFRQYIQDNYHLTQVFPLHGATQYEEQVWEFGSKPDNHTR
ncbi:hypothetical protein [Edaphobacter bradus]|uniref:hypothetical protein n=1 Tax=Edaphobacter bradus TaxID=2259016 RepID=UPI0021DFEF59|nr:hypothetical protein [Edaphobacter bradus]